MAKVILEFDAYEDQDAYELAINASKLASALGDIKNDVRSLWKYDIPDSVYAGDREGYSKENAVVDYIYELICERIKETGVDL